MTRGIKGYYIWCEDDGLRKYFKDRLNHFSTQIKIKDMVETIKVGIE